MTAWKLSEEAVVIETVALLHAGLTVVLVVEVVAHRTGVPGSILGPCRVGVWLLAWAVPSARPRPSACRDQPSTAVHRGTSVQRDSPARQRASDRGPIGGPLLDGEPELAEVITPLRSTLQTRLQRYTDRATDLATVEDDVLPVDDRYTTAVRIRREMIGAEREELLDWRDNGRLPDASLRVLQRELDHEESLLSPPPPR